MKRLLFAGLAGSTIVAASSAFAADMPVKAAPMVAPPPPVYWTGCYVGGNIGYGWADKSFSHVDTGDTIEIGFGIRRGDLIDDGSHTANGIVGGGQVGCDYQFTPNWVVGIQGMFDGADLTGSHVDPAYSYETVTFSTKVRWFATATARLGFLISPTFLMYAKGGAAWAGDSHALDISSIEYKGHASTGDFTRTGWDLGVGWEWMLAPNWSIWFEYDHMDFGSKDQNFVFEDGDILVEHVNQTVDKAMVGVNYRFGWGKTPAPVAARY